MTFNVLTADGLAIEDHFCNEETPDLSALLAAVRDATVAAMDAKRTYGTVLAKVAREVSAMEAK